MLVLSWNVNGLRAVVRKNFREFLFEFAPDVLCVQEIKAQPGDLSDDHTFFEGYDVFLHSAERKGYSGVATYSRKKPLAVIKGLGLEKFDVEGRVLTLEFDSLFVVNVYVPNAQPELRRIGFREEFNDALLHFVKGLEKKKPVLICGDFNVAHEEIDLKNPGPNRGHAGFSDEERAKFDTLLNAGFIDSFRFLHPDEVKYSWWSYRFNARSKNIGWRLDYLLVSESLGEKILRAEILNEVLGSDHCPVLIQLKL